MLYSTRRPRAHQIERPRARFARDNGLPFADLLPPDPLDRAPRGARRGRSGSVENLESQRLWWVSKLA